MSRYISTLYTRTTTCRLHQYQNKNPEKVKAWKKKWYDKHSERIKAQRRQRYKKNKAPQTT
jgi:hypothetical protein